MRDGPRRTRILHRKTGNPAGPVSVPQVPSDRRIQHSMGPALEERQPPPGADEGDRAKFAKLRDYLLRLDDEVTCKTCGKKFEIPSQHSLMFVDQLAGLPERGRPRTGDCSGVGRARERI